MRASRARSALGSVLLLFLFAAQGALRAQSATLFGQGASALLERQFGGKDASWLLLDRSGAMLAQSWDDPEESIPPGSLVKPFLAAAYASQHGDHFPKAQCKGTRSLCWLPRGHGEIDLQNALAQSCNGYFLMLAAAVDRDRALRTFRSLGLNGPARGFDAKASIGLGTAWRESPLALAHAYLELLDGPDTVLRALLRAGMERAAARGTAASVDAMLGDRAAIAKTGTAPCTHHPHAQADGFAIVLLPAADPRYLLLLRMHGATGAATASQAAHMLSALGLGQR